MSQNLLSFCDYYMDGISGLFVYAAADVFPQADDVARSLHPDQASVIGNTVKKGVNLNTAFTEFFPDIIREFYIGSVDIRDFQNKGIEFVLFSFII